MNNGFPWFPSGAKRISSIHSSVLTRGAKGTASAWPLPCPGPRSSAVRKASEKRLRKGGGSKQQVKSPNAAMPASASIWDLKIVHGGGQILSRLRSGGGRVESFLLGGVLIFSHNVQMNSRNGFPPPWRFEAKTRWHSQNCSSCEIWCVGPRQ